MPIYPRKLEKKLSYRINIPEGQERERMIQSARHWDGFTWETGRHIVEWVSPTHGNIQVWAISSAEGIGVIEHCLADMGASMDDGELVFSESKNPRFGRVGTVRAAIVALRNGSSGNAEHTYMLGQFANVEA